MVVSNIKMAKQDLRANSKSESGLPCDKCLDDFFHYSFACDVLLFALQYFIVTRDFFNRMSEGSTVFIHA